MTQWIISGSAKGLKQRISMIVKRPKMAIYALICLILVAAIAVGCTFTGGKNPDKQTDSTPPETTEATRNTEPTQNTAKPDTTEKLPDTIPGTPLTPDELAYFTQLFSGLGKENGEINWYNILLFCGWNLGDMKGFAVPEDVNFDTLFNNGFGDISRVSSWTPEELAFIQSFYPEFPKNSGDLYRLPAAMMDQVLQDYLGITIETSNKVWLDKMKYFPDTDCYFGAPAGAVGEGNVNMVDGKRTDDGTIYLLNYNDERFFEGKILLRLAPNPSNENAPYRVLTSMEIENESDYAEIMLSSLHLPSTPNGIVSTGIYKYFVYHNRPNSEVIDFGYNGKPYTLKDLAENGLYAVDDGAVYTISGEAVSEWEWDKFNDYIYFVRHSDPRKIWRTDLHGQNPTVVYESQYGDITFLSYYRDTHDWLLLIENSNRCAFFDMTAKKMTILPQVHCMEQFSYDASETRIFWKGQLNKSDPEMPPGGYTYYYYPKTNQYQLLKDNAKWVTVTPEQ